MGAKWGRYSLNTRFSLQSNGKYIKSNYIKSQGHARERIVMLKKKAHSSRLGLLYFDTKTICMY